MNFKEFYLACEDVEQSEEDRKSARKDCNTNPTEDQKISGNYKKGHFSWQGLGITIENPKGSTRSGQDKSGKKWSIKMQSDYGYFKKTESESDQDHIDVFVGPDLSSEIVFIVDQVVNGKWDEHKTVIGVKNEEEAKVVYFANYEKNWKGFAGITPMTLDDFKDWLFNGDTSKALSN